MSAWNKCLLLVHLFNKIVINLKLKNKTILYLNNQTVFCELRIYDWVWRFE